MALLFASFSMGTRFEILLEGEESAHPRAAGEAALAEIEELDRRLSFFRRDSLVSRLNRSAALAPERVDRDTFELFAEALKVARDSRGAFDIALGGLLAARRAGEPAPAEWPGSSAIELDARASTVFFTDPRVALDLGAIAKGHALDLAGRALREAGVTRALLHGGTSSVLALGGPWPIALERAEGQRVELCDAALSVSAAHGRRFPDGGGHVVDPRTGRSAADERLVAVVGARARQADAWSTALLVDPDPGLAPPDLGIALASGPRALRTISIHGAGRAAFVPSPLVA